MVALVPDVGDFIDLVGDFFIGLAYGWNVPLPIESVVLSTKMSGLALYSLNVSTISGFFLVKSSVPKSVFFDVTCFEYPSENGISTKD